MKIYVSSIYHGGDQEKKTGASVTVMRDGVHKHAGRNLRCGFCFPEGIHPGHFAIVCQLNIAKPEGVVCLIEEGTGNTVTELLTNIFTTLKKYRIFDLYCRVEPERDKEMFQEFNKFKRVNDVSASIRTGQHCNSFVLGLDLLADYVDREAMYMSDETAVYEQLKIMTSDDRKTFHESFGAVQALICAMSGYGRIRSMPREKKRGLVARKVDRTAWI
jgi:hypothetical protein